MWDTNVESLGGGRARRYSVRRSGAPASFAEVLRGWREDDGFRSSFLSLLADAPFEAYRWETPAVTAGTVGRPFEFVLLDAPGLTRAPEPEAFAGQFDGAQRGAGVVTFANLGKDAVLVVPLPVPGGDPGAYVHLAAFVRGAPEGQKHELWRAVGAAMEARLGAKPVWLSTAGAGVAWLHVRLDDRPKYYGHRVYAAGAAGER